MTSLPSDLRNKLERVIVDARDAAEAGAKAALEALAVDHYQPYPHMKPAQRELRNQLRARARQLGNRRSNRPDEKGNDQEIRHISRECAYEYWHRMIFARFLAENGLLIEPLERMAISLTEAEELAKEKGDDVWVFASRCAQRMLPQIFRPDDPLLQVSFATEHLLKLENLLAALPQPIFTTSDALGWVYQFWQSREKDKVNRSGEKIGADEIPAVTQLFTEPYMVAFLLHNTLGAWWAGKKLDASDAETAKNEEELRKKVALTGVGWEYLRFVEGADGKGGQWRPAAGTFEGWPKTAAELRVLDPCCGSGHFLVAALHHLVPIRMAEEGLTAREAVDAVLRDNLHGLEIDERCCQIAAFALALAAWTYPDAGGYRKLPELSIAQTGIAVGSTRDQWLAILQGSDATRKGFFFGQLYDLFRKAPTIGSLINPNRFLGSGMLTNKGMESLQASLQVAIAEDPSTSAEKHELGVVAQGLARATRLLAEHYTLVITNVPYLGRGKQDEILKEHLEAQYPLSKADLATAFVQRCLEFCTKDGSVAIVTPQNWLFLATYTKLREMLLDRQEWDIVARLGPGAFETIGGHVVNVALLALTATAPRIDRMMVGIDVSGAKGPGEKAVNLRGDKASKITLIAQSEQLKNPDAVVILEGLGRELLGQYADAVQGLTSGDNLRFFLYFWECANLKPIWVPLQSAPTNNLSNDGHEFILRWEEGRGELVRVLGEGIKGRPVWGRQAVLVRQIEPFPCSLYAGVPFEMSAAALVPFRPELLPAIYCFCHSEAFAAAIRKVDQKLNVTTATLAKINFEVMKWEKAAAEMYSEGLPEIESDDPTQWLFHGWPGEASVPLQVAVARLMGYRWPAEMESPVRFGRRAQFLAERCEELLRLADDDGIVCIPSVRGEEPAAERLDAVLVAAEIKPDQACKLADASDLDDWLRNRFFEEHCKLFHDRPFVWHIWDGRKRDGFHALVNYHKLCEGNGKGRKLLESLTYAYLGDWIARQKDGVRREEGGAEDRLAAAVELQNRLKAILEGEPPFDIFVRWKPLSEQPIGWEPDINDGVRLNIRPFLAGDLPAGRSGAGVLRWKPNVKWDKDRGKEPKRPIRDFPWLWGWDGSVDYAGGPLAEFAGERFNDCHYTNQFKKTSREQAGDKAAPLWRQER
jgi:N-6 DNA Methylase